MHWKSHFKAHFKVHFKVHVKQHSYVHVKEELRGGMRPIPSGKALLVRAPVTVKDSVIVGVMKSLSSCGCRLPAVWGEVMVASRDDASCL